MTTHVPETAKATDRIGRGLALRDQGKTWDEVATELGYADRASAFRSIVGHLRTNRDRNAATYRARQHAEILAGLEAVMPGVLAGDHQAILSAVRLWSREAALMGMDAPKQVQVSAGVLQEMEQAFGELRLVVMGEATDVTDDEEPDVLEG